jgi:hypothetical protein
MQISSNLLSGFISIEYGHVTIHKNQIIIAEQFVVLNYILNHFRNSFLPIHGTFADFIDILQLELVLQDYLNGFDVKDFVIYNENLLAI